MSIECHHCNNGKWDGKNGKAYVKPLEIASYLCSSLVYGNVHCTVSRHMHVLSRSTGTELASSTVHTRTNSHTGPIPPLILPHIHSNTCYSVWLAMLAFVLLPPHTHTHTHTQSQALRLVGLISDIIHNMAFGVASTEVCRLVGTSRMHGISNSKSPPKVSTCADFRRKFVPTNLQTSVVVGLYKLMAPPIPKAVQQITAVMHTGTIAKATMYNSQGNHVQ